MKPFGEILYASDNADGLTLFSSKTLQRNSLFYVLSLEHQAFITGKAETEIGSLIYKAFPTVTEFFKPFHLVWHCQKSHQGTAACIRRKLQFIYSSFECFMLLNNALCFCLISYTQSITGIVP